MQTLRRGRGWQLSSSGEKVTGIDYNENLSDAAVAKKSRVKVDSVGAKMCDAYGVGGDPRTPFPVLAMKQSIAQKTKEATFWEDCYAQGAPSQGRILALSDRLPRLTGAAERRTLSEP